MKRLTVILFAGLFVACGGQDSGSGADLPSIDAAKQAAAEAEAEMDAAADAAAEKASAAADAAAQQASDAAADAEAAAQDLTGMGEDPSAECLDLVSKGSFSAAIPVCTAALQANPTNTQVQEALAKARAETGQVADSAAAAGDAAKQGAQQAAGDAASDAVGNVLGN